MLTLTEFLRSASLHKDFLICSSKQSCEVGISPLLQVRKLGCKGTKHLAQIPLYASRRDRTRRVTPGAVLVSPAAERKPDCRAFGQYLAEYPAQGRKFKKKVSAEKSSPHRDCLVCTSITKYRKWAMVVAPGREARPASTNAAHCPHSAWGLTVPLKTQTQPSRSKAKKLHVLSTKNDKCSRTDELK